MDQKEKEKIQKFISFFIILLKMKIQKQYK